MCALPGGTVSFLFCDIGDSVAWWERDPELMQAHVDRFNGLAERAITGRGVIVKATGDGLMAAFDTAALAVDAALELQAAIRSESLVFAVRMGVHTGDADPTDGDYIGRTPNLAARVMSRARGGQILLSKPAADLIRRELRDGWSLHPAGVVALKGIERPEPVFDLTGSVGPGTTDRATPATGRLNFGRFTLDAMTRQLLDQGQPVALEPRTFDVLRYLVENRDRVVPKEELLDEIWGDRFVSESALATRVKHARAAIGDDGRAQRAIRTVHRVGYRFVAPVSEQRSAQRVVSGAPAGHVSAPWAAPVAKALFGREADLDAVRRRLEVSRLVTVTGPAGVGKTSLCERLLAEDLDVPPEGRWLCELAETRDPDAIANVVLATLGEAQHADADPAESLMRVLEDRADLLVLDNCEHLVDAASSLAREVLLRCRGVRILATSREPLGLDGESVHALEPLDIDAAVACFVARARNAGAEIDADDDALRTLCIRLDGIPLAIELAAARARVLGPADMLAFLDDRFRLLRETGTSGRHASLHAAIQTSWESLDADNQQLLGRLGLFVGIFTLDDVNGVALIGADPLDTVDALESLVRRSLVDVTGATRGRGRFRLLESVREFALARVSDLAAVRRAHVDHFVRRVQEFDAACQTEDVDDALADLREAWPNVRAAVGYAADDHDVDSVRRIVCAVVEYADVFGVYEVLDWCEDAGLDGDLASATDVPLAAEALAVRARTLAHQGHHGRARKLADRALELHRSHATLLSVAWCAYYTGQLDLVVELAPQLMALSRSERGLDRGYAEGFSAIVVAVRQEADLTTSAVSPADAERGVLGALDVLTEGLRLCTADPERAAELLAAVVENSIRNDYRLLLGAAASTLTQITLPARPPEDAMRTLRRTLSLYRERSMWNLIAADIVMAARLLADAGDAETAARLLGARLESGYAVGLSEVLASLLAHELETSLGDEYPSLIERGRRWRPPQAADVAIERLSRVLERRGGL